MICQVKGGRTCFTLVLLELSSSADLLGKSMAAELLFRTNVLVEVVDRGQHTLADVVAKYV